MHLDEIDGEGDVKELEITPLPTPDEVNWPGVVYPTDFVKLICYLHTFFTL